MGRCPFPSNGTSIGIYSLDLKTLLTPSFCKVSMIIRFIFYLIDKAQHENKRALYPPTKCNVLGSSHAQASTDPNSFHISGFCSKNCSRLVLLTPGYSSQTVSFSSYSQRPSSVRS